MNKILVNCAKTGIFPLPIYDEVCFVGTESERHLITNIFRDASIDVLGVALPVH